MEVSVCVCVQGSHLTPAWFGSSAAIITGSLWPTRSSWSATGKRVTAQTHRHILLQPHLRPSVCNGFSKTSSLLRETRTCTQVTAACSHTPLTAGHLSPFKFDCRFTLISD